MLLPLIVAAALEFTAQDAHVAYETAKSLVAECTPRDAGTIRSRIATNRILDVASMTGADVRRDVFRAKTPKGEREFVNLYAEFESGGDTSRWVVVVSHFDTKPGTRCPGANDGAATTGLLVGLVNALERRTDPKGNVLLVWTDGEECMESYGPDDGLWGSRRAVEQVLSGGRKVQAVICVDMIGDRDLAITVPANWSPELCQVALRAAKRIGFPDLVRLGDVHVKDDHVPFMDRGCAAIDLIDISYGPANSYWHTEKDTMENVSEESLLKSGRLVAEMLNILL